MATEFLTTDQSGRYTIDNGDEVFLVDGAILTSSTDGFNFASDNDGFFNGDYFLFLAGDIYVLDDVLVQGFTADTGSFDDVDLNIQIGSTAQLFSNGDAFVVSASDPDIESSSITISNAGGIFMGEAVLFASGFDEVNFTNTGTINQGSGSLQNDQAVFATLGQNGDNRIFNSGTITASQTSSIVDTSLSSGGTLSFVNSGVLNTMSGLAFEVFGSLGSFSLVNTGEIQGGINSDGSDDIENHGEIFGTIDLASFTVGDTVRNTNLIAGDILFSSGSDTVTNLGRITGDVLLDNGSNRLENSGEMLSDVTAGTGVDLIINNGSISGFVILGAGDDIYRGSGENGGIFGGSGDDNIRTGAANDVIDAGDNNDMVHGGAGNDDIFGGNGDDIIRGGLGEDIIGGGNDADTLRGGADNDTLFGGENNDTLMGGDGDDDLNGGNGNDVLFGMHGQDNLIGGNGSDDLHGGMGDDILTGGGGKDDLFGDQGDDIMNGGGAADTLTGGRGDDTLTGGDGPDTFIFSLQNGHDVVTDFEDGTDLLDFSAFNIASGADLKTGGTDTAAGYLIDLSTFGGSGSVLIEGITEADIGPADLIL